MKSSALLKTVFFAETPHINKWDNCSIGYYWNKYEGNDNNGDGIGDNPYTIYEENQDNYPLMNPVDITTIPEFPSWVIFPLVLIASLMVLFFKKRLIPTFFS